jgi:hypothetical protein
MSFWLKFILKILFRSLIVLVFLAIFLFAALRLLISIGMNKSSPDFISQTGKLGVSIDGDYYYDVCCGRKIVLVEAPRYPVITIAEKILAQNNGKIFATDPLLGGKFMVDGSIPLAEGPIIPLAWRNLPKSIGVRVSLLAIHEWAPRIGIVFKKADKKAKVPKINLIVNGVVFCSLKPLADGSISGIALPLFENTTIELRAGNEATESLMFRLTPGGQWKTPWTWPDSLPGLRLPGIQERDLKTKIAPIFDKAGLSLPTTSYDRIEFTPDGYRLDFHQIGISVCGRPIPTNDEQFRVVPHNSEPIAFWTRWRFTLKHQSGEYLGAWEIPACAKVENGEPDFSWHPMDERWPSVLEIEAP